jgi:ABC-type Zn uptake system ZnuABC Zn-binding protein ZnuA
VRDALTTADPAGAADYTAWCDLYCGQLRVVDAWIRRQIGSLPPERRILATTHTALAYYADAYGLRLYAVEGVTTGQEPDPRHFARLIAMLRRDQVPAVFSELGSAPTLMERLAHDAGTALGGPLVADTLPEGMTYIGMLTLNTRMIVRALQPH